MFDNYRSNNDIQLWANNYVSYFDNKIFSDGTDPIDDYPGTSDSIVRMKTVFFELDPQKDKYSNSIFNKYIEKKISFKNYFQSIFKHQIGPLNKYGKNKQIGVFIYPQNTINYGKIILVISDI